MILNHSTSILNSLNDIKALISEAENIIITTHLNPDADALGSSLAIFNLLLDIGKNPKLFIPNRQAANLNFLPGSNHAIPYSSKFESEIINTDLILIVDLNQISRLKELGVAISSAQCKKIVIDHHLEPEQFADVYAIDTNAAASGLLVWQLLQLYSDFKISESIANNLYAAIMTDTGCFRYPRTNSYVHQVVSQLIELGADPINIYEQIYNQNSKSTLQLLARGLASMSLYHNGMLNLMMITREDFDQCNASIDDLEGIVEKSLSLVGVKIGALLVEIPEENEIKLSIRSKEDYNIRKIASVFGGGGHLNAAGARIAEGEINDIKKQIITLAGLELNRRL